MDAIFQNALPAEMDGTPGLPGVAPCGPEDWLRLDDAYAGQMAYRAALLSQDRSSVLWLDPDALAAAVEVLEEALTLLPALGFVCDAQGVTCPDGRRVMIDMTDPLGTLGLLVQEDICLMQKRGDEHVLTGAVLCFPASWLLSEKVGRPLTGIHDTVDEYGRDLARRVQRLFDGVRVGKPMWRFNYLTYADADLHQPLSVLAHREIEDDHPFIRAERQCILRLPRTQAVIFSIHTYVVPR
ncbi:hypothetical protein C1J03_15190 [Sulfitobacter sp. SK012]|uniref:heme-dependent oxidative N-demethylase family protein n=1 Tax=Sulfitobacter sp. SK012 TaxID=1389005 RepID=UPI000E0C16E9|nr:DUF3445 domain-containing protein [Sulfitobacter sp. SK012]AXI47236.1 hypothetical protein C1J03_15190 [Sulfitobacter sp. SK012]